MTSTWPQQITDAEMRQWIAAPSLQVDRINTPGRLSVRVTDNIEWGVFELRSARILKQPPADWLWSDAVESAQTVETKVEQRWVLMQAGIMAVQPSPTHKRGNSELASDLHSLIPGANVSVRHPCTCDRSDDHIWQVIQHLNDHHHPARNEEDAWTRERIADWLDTLDADLTVDTERAERRRDERERVRQAKQERVAHLQKMMDDGTIHVAMAGMQASAKVVADEAQALHETLQKMVDSMSVPLAQIQKSLGIEPIDTEPSTEGTTKEEP